MEKLIQFEKLASENLLIAENDKRLAKKLKSLAKSELERSKAMSQLVKKELQLTKIRKEVAENIKDLVEEKLKLKENGVLKFSNEELRKEINFSIYTGKIAIVQKLIAENEQEIAKLERVIALVRQKYAEDTLTFAKKREELSKKLLLYIKAVKEKQPDAVIMKTKKGCKNMQQELIKKKKLLLLKEGDIRMKENNLSDLEKKLGLKFSELERIRHSDI
jgi:hypothetical protein